MNQRPAARRVPAKSKKQQLNTRGYISIVIIVAAVFVVGLCIINSITSNTKSEIEDVQAANYELENQLKELQDELAFIKTDKGIELYARAQGMCMPGEVRYTAGTPR